MTPAEGSEQHPGKAEGAEQTRLLGLEKNSEAREGVCLNVSEDFDCFLCSLWEGCEESDFAVRSSCQPEVEQALGNLLNWV